MPKKLSQEIGEMFEEYFAKFHKEVIVKLDELNELVKKQREALRLHMDTRKKVEVV